MIDNSGRAVRMAFETGFTASAVARVEAILAENPDATGADVLAELRRQAADARAAEIADRDRPAWTYAAENLEAARVAGYDV